MSEASERERVILGLLDSLTELGFDIEDAVFQYEPELKRWVVFDAEHAEILSSSEHAEVDHEARF